MRNRLAFPVLATLIMILRTESISAQPGILEYETCRQGGREMMSNALVPLPVIDRTIFGCSKVISDKGLPSQIRTDAHLSRGTSYFLRSITAPGVYPDDSTSADLDLSEVIRLEEFGPTKARAYAIRGNVRHEHVNPGRAIRDFSEALRLNLTELWGDNLYFLRGSLYIKTGEKDRAAADFRSALKIDPGHELARKALGDMGVQP